jgi:HEAT repeat protein
MTAKRNVKGLIKALGYRQDHHQTPCRAAEALGQVGDARAVEPLIAALKDFIVWDVRKAAAEALGQIGDVRAVDPLIAALNDGAWRVREAAAGVLGQIGDVRAVNSLIAGLKDQERVVREAAFGALDDLGYRPAQDENGAAYWVAKQEWDKCVEIGPPAVPPLIAALKAGSSAAAIALGEIGDARAIAPLMAALRKTNDGASEAAVGALARIGAPAVGLLVAALKDWDDRLCERAAGALVKVGAPAVEPLIAALKDWDDRLRERAAGALGQIGDARAVEPLIAKLGSCNWSVRNAAAKSLVKLFQSNLLDEAHKSLILVQRGRISASHEDGARSLDNCGMTAVHVDNGGIGLPFPV